MARLGVAPRATRQSRQFRFPWPRHGDDHRSIGRRYDLTMRIRYETRFFQILTAESCLDNGWLLMELQKSCLFVSSLEVRQPPQLSFATRKSSSKGRPLSPKWNKKRNEVRFLRGALETSSDSSRSNTYQIEKANAYFFDISPTPLKACFTSPKET